MASEGFIGEKGIGFKSVFKVANVVHVASGHYQFKLDRREPLGMILPRLSTFSEAASRHHSYAVPPVDQQ